MPTSKSPMIFRGLLLILHLAAGPAYSQLTNQRLYDTIPTMPDYWPKRVAVFTAEPVVTGKVIFLGNSITQGGDWAKLLGDPSIINRGIGGDVTYGLLQRLDDVIARRPSKLFILIGINDISKDIPDVVIADNCRKIIIQIRRGSPKTRIFLQSILPLNPQVENFPQHYNKADRVVSTNKLLEKVALDMQVTFIDLYTLFVDTNGMLPAEYTADGLHLNGRGYEKWCQFLLRSGYLKYQ